MAPKFKLIQEIDSSAGFVLLTSLIFLFLMTLLMLSNGETFNLAVKIFASYRINHLKSYELEKQAKSIILNQNFKPECTISTLSPIKIIHFIRAGGGCFVSKQISYVIQEIGEIPCLSLQSKQGIFSTDHKWLWLSDEHEILQVHFVTPIQYQACNGKETVVNTITQSWNILPF